MKYIFKIFILTLLFQSCKNNTKEVSSINPINWSKREVKQQLTDSLIHATSYLSVYSHIYSQTEHITYDLTATISIRNTNKTDTIYLNKAEYFDTHGKSIRTYFNKPIYIAPMETIEIVIDEKDGEGGSGANFLFDWSIKPNINEPLFEAVMISTSGQQGLSFTTQGIKTN